ncbi:FAD-dependent oxidoreductase [Paenibacillus melissococcoides]|uniref:FAD-dependent oxidoreductase n=1 Tax=Paenibacillus melissococcoides TaxID=2912268 RepID=A0ABN8U215_9BACL|nr:MULTISPECIES: FAD-dependent oxidoreductase [Paenibacillus]MEB9892388.1 FAD-dependent oxidoreductase [Bacillus cereus]CAH8245096.1 FAD-dependent oxidoreductase [Paenibacillus melissococcoides]CAH8709889.1 FAD-dependent oxidoreductase [Paenibacillus melissococcoides]CAH8710616.1 FAD-dependent oxidoreductase [Paenibacillus melissococcoides]GIO81665.1 pyridine nucleotide-disulfide oxidoreductase [Paenibacillus dendritiformis]
MAENRHYVIVGSGVASVHAAKAIRDHDDEAQISIFGEEPALPYNRVKLSKGLFTDLHSEKIVIKKEKWFRENRITVHDNTRISSIHTGKKAVMTADGREIAYHKLLLCTGATNRKLSLEGASLPNVHNIRDKRDADQFKEALRTGDRVCVIGGGIQGLETAWSLIQAGYSVTIIEAGSRLMPRQLDAPSAAKLRKYAVECGAEVRLGQGVTRIIGEGAGRADGIELEDGSILACEHIVYSIGIIPNIALAREAGLETGTGIIVNERMQTNDCHIYAAGDCAEFQGKVDGLWGCAIEQGRVAGANMANQNAVYRRPVPMTLSNTFNTPLFSIGLVDEQQCDASITDSAQGRYRRIFIKGGSLCGAIAFENAAASLPYQAAIEQKLPLDGIDAASCGMEEVMNEIARRLQ